LRKLVALRREDLKGHARPEGGAAARTRTGPGLTDEGGEDSIGVIGDEGDDLEPAAAVGACEDIFHVCQARVSKSGRRDPTTARCSHSELAPDKAPGRCPRHGDLPWPKSQVRPIRFHDPWRTCASLLLQPGCSLPVVSRVLGHADVRITLERNGHIAPEYLRAEVDRLSFGPAVARFAPPVLRASEGRRIQAGNSSMKPEEFPASGLERETGFEPATLSLGS
jgi:hypothetical protein